MTVADWIGCLLPVPETVEAPEDGAVFPLFSGFTVAAHGEARAAVLQFVAWARKIRGESIAVQFADGDAARLVARCGESAEVDESYELVVDAALAQVRLTAVHRVGVLRGLATLLQLTVLGGGDLRDCRIVDRPRFAWRGLMVDVARHFIPKDLLLRTLDAMALCKLNVLHLHLTDDQGFRIESKAFPRLHELGSEGRFFTQEDIRELVARADALGIRVVPEFDVPGHACSWLVGHPELGCRPGASYQLADSWGCQDVCMDPTSGVVLAFLGDLFDDVLPLFPDPVVHIGGDEVQGDEWRATPHIAEFMADCELDARGMQGVFNRRLQTILAARGKRMMGWEEVVDPKTPKDVLVQSWRSAESAARTVAAGHQCVRSHGYYLDALESADVHYAVDPVEGLEEGVDVLGGEACLWTEFVDADNFESRLWPRAAVLAERWWSPPGRTADGLHPARMLMTWKWLEQLGVAVSGRVADEAARAQAQFAGAMGLSPAKRDGTAPMGSRHEPLSDLVSTMPVENIVVSMWRMLVRGRSLDPLESQLSALGQDVGELWEFGDTLRDRQKRAVEIGLAALAALRASRSVDGQWIRGALVELDECAEPDPESGLYVAITHPVRELVELLR